MTTEARWREGPHDQRLINLYLARNCPVPHKFNPKVLEDQFRKCVAS
jgi:hypothetical protein